MATVTGLTAERMETIEAASIVDGEVVGDNLILTRFDASTIDAGSVRGPIGSPGISEASFQDHLPIGTIVDYIGTIAPSAKWLLMTGQTVVGGQTTYATLWSRLPASMKSGADILMPNTKGRVTVGYDSNNTKFDTIGETGGAEVHTLTQAELPAVGVTVNPPSTAVTGSTGTESAQHTHRTSMSQSSSMQAGGSSVVTDRGSFTGVYTDVESATHTHPAGTLAVDIAQFSSGNMGSGSSHNILQPYIVFLKIIKVL